MLINRRVRYLSVDEKPPLGMWVLFFFLLRSELKISPTSKEVPQIEFSEGPKRKCICTKIFVVDYYATYLPGKLMDCVFW
jgi:hypothetical protein